MRNLNATNEPILDADLTVTRQCSTCGSDMQLTVAAGTRKNLAKTLLGLGVECEKCAGERERVETAEAHEQERLHRVRASGLPATLQGLTWDSYDTSRPGAAGALGAAQAWATRSGEKPGLLLTGGVGVGKTRLAATAVWDAALPRLETRIVQGVPVERDRGFMARWISVPELIVSIGAGFGDSDRARALKVLTGSGPLVLDDLDKVTASTWVLSNLFTAVDRRVQSGAPIIVTTNLTPSKLVEKFTGSGRDAEDRQVAADALVSRLLGHCTVRGISGADGRRS